MDLSMKSKFLCGYVTRTNSKDIDLVKIFFIFINFNLVIVSYFKILYIYIFIIFLVFGLLLVIVCFNNSLINLSYKKMLNKNFIYLYNYYKKAKYNKNVIESWMKGLFVRGDLVSTFIIMLYKGMQINMYPNIWGYIGKIISLTRRTNRYYNSGRINSKKIEKMRNEKSVEYKEFKKINNIETNDNMEKNLIIKKNNQENDIIEFIKVISKHPIIGEIRMYKENGIEIVEIIHTNITHSRTINYISKNGYINFKSQTEQVKGETNVVSMYIETKMPREMALKVFEPVNWRMLKLDNQKGEEIMGIIGDKHNNVERAVYKIAELKKGKTKLSENYSINRGDMLKEIQSKKIMEERRSQAQSSLEDLIDD